MDATENDTHKDDTKAPIKSAGSTSALRGKCVGWCVCVCDPYTLLQYLPVSLSVPLSLSIPILARASLGMGLRGLRSVALAAFLASLRGLTATATATASSSTANDFAAFNEEIQNLRLTLADPAPLSQQILFQLDIALTNVYCQNITIGDIRGEYYQQEEALNTSNSNSSNTLLLLYRLAVDPYSMTCFTDYSYTYGGFLSNSGTARMQLTDNGVTMTFGVSSLSNSLSSNSSSNSSSSSLPPNETTVQSCEPRVVITDLQLSGGVESFIVQLFSEAVTNAVEGVVTSST
jgi:hypothetical protein